MTQRQLTTKIKSAVVLSMAVFISACASTASMNSSSGKDQKASDNAAGTLLLFLERESGTESYTSRVFVNSKYMKVSDSQSPADYILFNRDEKIIYSVTSDDKSIFVIRNKPHNFEPPIEIEYKEESQPSAAIPKVDNRQAIHYRYYANGEHCYDAVVLGGNFMPDVLAAMREFRQVLANEHASTVNNMPKDTIDACDISLNIFHATKHMDHGIPIREWDRRGYQRFMKDYRTDVTPPEGEFDLPKDFRRYSLEDIGSPAAAGGG